MARRRSCRRWIGSWRRAVAGIAPRAGGERLCRCGKAAVGCRLAGRMGDGERAGGGNPGDRRGVALQSLRPATLPRNTVIDSSNVALAEAHPTGLLLLTRGTRQRLVQVGPARP